MPGPSFNWNQYQQDQSGGLTDMGDAPGGWNQPQQTRTMDPSQAIPNTGVTGYGPGGMPPPGIDSSPSGMAAPAPVGSNGQDPQAFFNQLFPGDTLTPEMLTQNEAALKAQGITLVKNAAGVPGKIQLPNGQVIDVIQGAGSGLNRKQWLTGDGGASGGGMGSLNNLGQSFGYMVSPQSEFAPPSAEDALNSPGSQYALGEAQRLMQNSAAAKGTLLNGRVLQAENNALLQNANQLYGDVFNRNLQAFNTNYGVKTGNQDRPFSKYLSLADLGQRAASAS